MKANAFCTEYFQWARITPANNQSPTPRWGHTATLVSRGNALGLLVIGGFVQGSSEPSPEVWHLSLSHIRWKNWPEIRFSGSSTSFFSLETKPEEQSCRVALHTTVLAGSNTIIVFGGRGVQSPSPVNGLYMLDTEADTMSWTSPKTFGDIPSPRENHSATMISSSAMAVVGGWDGKKWLNDIFILDVENMSWTRIRMDPAVLPPLSEHTTLLFDWRVAIAGGTGAQGANSSIWLWDTVTMECKPFKNPLPSALTAHTTTSIGPYIFIFGGVITDLVGSGGDRANISVGFNEKLTVLRRDTLEKVQADVDPGMLPTVRAHHSATAISSSALLVFGGCNKSEVFNELWVLHLPAPRAGQSGAEVKPPSKSFRLQLSGLEVGYPGEEKKLHPAFLSGETRTKRIVQVRQERAVVRETVLGLKKRLSQQEEGLANANRVTREQTDWLELEVERLSTGVGDLEDRCKFLEEDQRRRREEVAFLRRSMAEASGMPLEAPSQSPPQAPPANPVAYI
ncbi:hypothetical protein CYMTET_48854 [Cymbomonas tetramitiformis]|uniref:Galactose oxidase n=1 Tax=Cymbomonas tetramitiformis TaxID=36881 RepID=A0AAE0BRC8_9CHLO|nr:hypothetical protein CYMTET_48854 [Cymbomonas tetramitiformis]